MKKLNRTYIMGIVFIILALLFPNVIVLFPPWLFPGFIIKNQNIKNIINSPNGVNKLSIVIKIDSDFSSKVNAPSFRKSSVYDIKLSISGILTSFFTLSSLIATVAVLPSASICILSTFPSLICATNSEYFSFELLFSNIEDSTTINITPIISHIANVLIPFFI